MTILPPRRDSAIHSALVLENVMRNLREAQIAEVVMKGRNIDETARDIATESYVKAVDAIFEDLSILAERGDLERFRQFAGGEAHR